MAAADLRAMPLKRDELVFLSVPEEEAGFLHIKVGADLGAALGFSSTDVALYFARHHHLAANVLQAHELEAGVYGEGPLLVFRSANQIDEAYLNQRSYDFSGHVEDWPEN